MTHSEKITELRNILREALTPLINSDYVFLEVPYYENLGDTLIWEGTHQLLKEIPYRCLWQTDLHGWDGRIFSKETLILLQGGGNFGDIWTCHHDFRKKVIEKHPNNKIIILPQTIYYNDTNKLKEDATFFANYANVTICTRDSVSYNIIKENFINNVLLLPDMAFFIDAYKYSKGEQKGKTLYLKRNDVELVSAAFPSFVPNDAEVFDWPDPRKSRKHYIYRKIMGLARRVRLHKSIQTRIRDLYWQKILKKHYVTTAVHFLDQYDLVYSTRLHVSILSMMLGKNIKMLDNSYGKNSSFYQAWFNNVDNVEWMENS